jgi:hypothetical protein
VSLALREREVITLTGKAGTKKPVKGPKSDPNLIDVVTKDGGGGKKAETR